MLDQLILVTDAASFDAAYTRTRGNILERHGLPRGRKNVRLQSGSIMMWGRPVGADQPWIRVTDGPIQDMKSKVIEISSGRRWEYVLTAADQDANRLTVETN